MTYITDIPKELYSWISDQNPLKTGMVYQIKYWWQAFSDLYQRCNLDQILGVISREDCWIIVDNVHGTMLNGSKVGEILVEEDPSNSCKNFIIASRCCLEQHIELLKREHQYELSGSPWNSLENFIWEKGIRDDTMVTFWLMHNVEDFTVENLRLFELGLNMSIESNQLIALKYFWDKINTLAANKMNNGVKDNMVMEYAIKIIKMPSSRPEIFEFFSQMNPSEYLKLLREDRIYNLTCKPVRELIKTLRFKDVKILYNVLPLIDAGDSYRCLLQILQVQHLSHQYMDAAVSLLKYVSVSEGFEIHYSDVPGTEEFIIKKRTNLELLQDNPSYMCFHNASDTKVLLVLPR